MHEHVRLSECVCCLCKCVFVGMAVCYSVLAVLSLYDRVCGPGV